VWIGSVKAYILCTPSVCLRSIILGITLGLQYLHGKLFILDTNNDSNSLVEFDNTIIHGDLKAVRLASILYLNRMK
jgi:serine/threonine protein kinase